ncbi:MAG: LLM class flavin-dependent oxidoreductase, partial [Acidimicrobiaceae bacterium]|nr:LLM class flavin-dependent oxidoreductase [Acidimicrobiaceae bacterium]
MVAVGVSVPWGLWNLPPDEQRRLLGRIADAGIDHVFTADHVSFRDGSGMDGLVTLAAVGGLEPRLDLLVGVYLLALRHPMVAARQIATLAEAAPGRLTIGVGVGG